MRLGNRITEVGNQKPNTIRLMPRIFQRPVCFLRLKCATSGQANNLTITNVALTNMNLVAGIMDVSFDIAWENSWRVVGGLVSTRSLRSEPDELHFS